MKIRNIRVWKKDLGNKRPYTIAFKTVSDVGSVFVRLELDNGLTGIGAGNPSFHVVGETLDDSMNALSEGNLEFLKGRDVRDFYALLKEVQERMPKTPAARAALDIALYDVFTKYLEKPLGVFLGQKIKSMETSVTIGIKNPVETVAEAEEYYDLGFRCLKVKTGLSPEEDVERMVKLRERFGNTMRIRVDANQGYDRAGMEKFYNETLDHDIELIEQPIKFDAVDEMKSLPDKIKRLIAADESLKTPKDAFRLVSAPRACGIFNIKLMKSGGIFPALQIARIAEASDTELMWGCNDESAVSISAALHAALSSHNTKYIDLDGSLDLVVDVVKGGFEIENGYMSLTDKAGLGVMETE